MADERGLSKFAFAKIVLSPKGRAMIEYSDGKISQEEAAEIAGMAVEDFLIEHARLGWGRRLH